MIKTQNREQRKNKINSSLPFALSNKKYLDHS
jgi:hypothetical protein